MAGALPRMEQGSTLLSLGNSIRISISCRRRHVRGWSFGFVGHHFLSVSSYFTLGASPFHKPAQKSSPSPFTHFFRLFYCRNGSFLYDRLLLCLPINYRIQPFLFTGIFLKGFPPSLFCFLFSPSFHLAPLKG